MELSPEIARTSRLFCSESCRARAYRERKEKAVQLAAEGKTPKEIAAELDSDVKTVKGWIKQRKG
jgi:DNA-binding NarL/FixJ family response regulator